MDMSDNNFNWGAFAMLLLILVVVIIWFDGSDAYAR